MDTNKWVDFLISLAETLKAGNYTKALSMADEVLNTDLNDGQRSWLTEAVATIKERHNL